MKKYLIPLTLLSILLVLNFACEDTLQEECAPEEICAGETVTACCSSDNVCTYTYNGKEYSEDELSDLAIDIGCSSTASIDYVDDIEVIEMRLQDLVAKVRAKL